MYAIITKKTKHVPGYLTRGVAYEIMTDPPDDIIRLPGPHTYFSITADNGGNPCRCMKENCFHLGKQGSWRFIHNLPKGITIRKAVV